MSVRIDINLLNSVLDVSDEESSENEEELQQVDDAAEFIHLSVRFI